MVSLSTGCVMSLSSTPSSLEMCRGAVPHCPLPPKPSPFTLLSAHYCASALGVDSLLLKKNIEAFGSLQTSNDSRWAYLGRWPRDTCTMTVVTRPPKRQKPPRPPSAHERAVHPAEQHGQTCSERTTPSLRPPTAPPPGSLGSSPMFVKIRL